MSSKCCSSEKESLKLKSIANFFNTIADENRIRILCLLKKESKCVCEIWSGLGIAQNLASYHLKVLKDLGVIKSEKKGFKVFYTLDKEKLDQYLSHLNSFLK